MSNKGIKIRYGNFSPNAKDNFEVASTESQFDTLSQLEQYSLSFPNYANPCELYQTVLDGMAMALPSTPNEANLGLWSEQVSDGEGNFSEPIQLYLSSEGLFSSNGLTLTFDTQNNIFPKRINIKWYNGENVLFNTDYEPDNSIYVIDDIVEGFDKIIVTFFSINMPYNRLKVRSIDYGFGTYFEAKNARDIRIVQQISPISTEIKISTADFVLDIDSQKEYLFQRGQPISVEFNGELMSTTFIKTSRRKSKNLWQIQSEDYIGLMEGVPFAGGMYNEAPVINILHDIFATAKIPFDISPDFAEQKVSGYIPYTNCRNALMQVCFAIQGVADTSYSDVVKIYSVDDNVSQKISLNRIMQGQSFDNEEVVTAVELTSHNYSPITDTMDVYRAKDGGTNNGEEIFIKFSEPMHHLSITSGAGQIVTPATNYAIIKTTDENCVLTGQKYEHTTSTKQIKNEAALKNNAERVISIKDAYLISSNNVDNVLEKCYNYLTRTRTTNLKIVEGRHTTNDGVEYDQKTSVGQVISTETEYLGEITGRIIKQSFSLIGGIIVKDSQIR